MAFWNRKKKKTGQSSIRFDSSDYKEDFFDYQSKLAGTPQRFGDTRPFIDVSQSNQNYELLNSLYHTNGIAHKIVTKPAEDATRNGWRIIITNDPDKQAKYQKALDDLDLKKVLSQELIYYYLHGDAYITYGLDEDSETDLSEPLSDPPLINSIAFVHAFGQNHVQKIEFSNDPTSEDYMKEKSLIVNVTKNAEELDANGMPKPQTNVRSQVRIDRSRYFHISMDKLEDDDTGNSILNRCYDQIKTLDTALYSAGKILYAFDINVVYTDQMPDPESPESLEDFNARKRQLKEGMGTDSVLLLNDGEKFERISTSLGGIDTLLQFAWQNLAAASNIPKSVLLGEQAGTLAGASQDVANYYDGVKAIQEELLRPQLERIIRLLMWSSDVADGSEDPKDVDWKLQFNPLWSTDDKTQSETTLNTVNAGGILVDKGAMTPDELKEWVASQSNNAVQQMQFKSDSVDDLEMAKKLQRDLENSIHGKK